MIRKPFKHVVETLFRIPNKKGEIVPFYLNNVQDSLHGEICLHNFLDILKFRQPGITSIIMAFFLVECMSAFNTSVMIAHDKDHTEKLLQRARLLVDLMRGPKPKLSRLNDQEMYFSKTHSTFYIGTAGSRTFGRSATITRLHCSEVAFWREPQVLMTGLLQAVPHETGVVIKESTANGFGTYHHKQYLSALKNESKFHPVFFPWYIFTEYQSRTPLRMPYTEKEFELKEKFSMTDTQLQWRREKIEEFNGDEAIFCQEYPSTIEEAFLVSGGSLFPNVETLSPQTGTWSKAPSPYGVGSLFLQTAHPVKEYHYIFGVDSSGGTGNDFSVIEGLCLETREQVLSYSTNILAPPAFAEVICDLGAKYNNAFVVPESNQHGLSVIDILKNREPYASNKSLIYKMAPRNIRTPSSVQSLQLYGFRTNATSKYKLIGNLLKLLPELNLYHIPTVDELRSFGETETGELCNLSGDHDDHVMALALACEGMLKLQLLGIGYTPKPIETQTALPKGSATLEDIKERIKPKSKSYFGEQVKPYYGDNIFNF